MDTASPALINTQMSSEFLDTSTENRLVIADTDDDDSMQIDKTQADHPIETKMQTSLSTLLPPPPLPPALLPKPSAVVDQKLAEHQSIENDHDQSAIEEGELEEPCTSEEAILSAEEPLDQPSSAKKPKLEAERSCEANEPKAANPNNGQTKTTKRAAKKKLANRSTDNPRPPSKQKKMERPGNQNQNFFQQMQEHADVSTWVRSVATEVDSESLGPCEPGTHVNLDGIVWNETANGLLVVNVTWRGKSYVGTLLDCTRFDWAPPRLADSPLLELTPAKGSRSHKRGAKNNPSNSNAASSSSSNASINNIGGGLKTSASFAGLSSQGTKAAKVNARLTVNIPAGSSGEQDDDSNHSSTNNSQSEPNSQLQPHSPVLLDCPCQSCNKQFSSNTALKYHQNFAHRPMRSVKDEPEPGPSPPILETSARSDDNLTPSTSCLNQERSVPFNHAGGPMQQLSIKKELQHQQNTKATSSQQEPNVNLSPEESASLQKMFDVVKKQREPGASDDAINSSSPAALKLEKLNAKQQQKQSVPSSTIKSGSIGDVHQPISKSNSVGPSCISETGVFDSRARSRSPGAYSDISDDGAPVLEKQSTDQQPAAQRPHQSHSLLSAKHTHSASSQTMPKTGSSGTPKSVAVVQPQQCVNTIHQQQQLTVTHNNNNLQASPSSNHSTGGSQLPTNAVSPNQTRAGTTGLDLSTSSATYNEHQSLTKPVPQPSPVQQPILSQNTAVHLAGLSMPRVAMTPMLTPSMTGPAPPTAGFVHHGFMGPPTSLAYHPHAHMQPHHMSPFEMFLPNSMHQHMAALQQQQMQQQHSTQFMAAQHHQQQQQIAAAGLSPGQQHKIHELKGGSSGSVSSPQMGGGSGQGTPNSHTRTAVLPQANTPPAAIRASPQTTPQSGSASVPSQHVLNSPFMHSPHQYPDPFAMSVLAQQQQQQMQPK